MKTKEEKEEKKLKKSSRRKKLASLLWDNSFTSLLLDCIKKIRNYINFIPVGCAGSLEEAEKMYEESLEEAEKLKKTIDKNYFFTRLGIIISILGIIISISIKK